MITLQGKYNKAYIFIDNVDKTTIKQIRGFLNHPAFQKTYIAIMPDCHAGAGACIGLTMKMNDYIIPNIVGVDIGCGVDSYCLGNIDIDYKKLDEFIRKNIPSGFSGHSKILYSMGNEDKKLKEVITNTGQDEGDVYRKIGTLGGGNHFIEIDEDNKGRKWLTIHSGSRNFGHKVATYHQNKAKELMKKMFIGEAYKQLEFLPLAEGGYGYLRDMELAQSYAKRNRWAIAERIIGNFLGITIGKLEVVSSVHNYIDLKNKIIRKGAISAYKNQRVIIPFNMRDGILIGKGKENNQYNCSAPHGAGRIMSRCKAKETLNIEEFKNTMKNVWSSSVNERTLDEAPMAYKDKNIILSNISDTVEVEFFLKPVYNFKDDTKKRRRKR